MQTQILILIIMYVYRTLISALSIHIIHINLNMIFYTHNNLHKVLYRHTHTAMNLNVHDIGQYHTSYMLAHTHTHTDYGCSRNWVLILVGTKILWEEKGFQFGFKGWQSWPVSKVLWEWIPNVESKAKEGVKTMSLAFVLLDFQYAGVRRRA